LVKPGFKWIKVFSVKCASLGLVTKFKLADIAYYFCGKTQISILQAFISYVLWSLVWRRCPWRSCRVGAVIWATCWRAPGPEAAPQDAAADESSESSCTSTLPLFIQ